MYLSGVNEFTEVFDLGTGQFLSKVAPLKHLTACIAMPVDPATPCFVSGSTRAEFQLYDLRQGKRTCLCMKANLMRDYDLLRNLKFIEDRTILAATMGVLQLYDLRSSKAQPIVNCRPFRFLGFVLLCPCLIPCVYS
jgi:hypothetical protein